MSSADRRASLVSASDGDPRFVDRSSLALLRTDGYRESILKKPLVHEVGLWVIAQLDATDAGDLDLELELAAAHSAPSAGKTAQPMASRDAHFGGNDQLARWRRAGRIVDQRARFVVDA
jgi:hypothetical protein